MPASGETFRQAVTIRGDAAQRTVIGELHPSREHPLPQQAAEDHQENGQHHANPGTGGFEGDRLGGGGHDEVS